ATTGSGTTTRTSRCSTRASRARSACRASTTSTPPRASPRSPPRTARPSGGSTRAERSTRARTGGRRTGAAAPSPGGERPQDVAGHLRIGLEGEGVRGLVRVLLPAADVLRRDIAQRGDDGLRAEVLRDHAEAVPCGEIGHLRGGADGDPETG